MVFRAAIGLLCPTGIIMFTWEQDVLPEYVCLPDKRTRPPDNRAVIYARSYSTGYIPGRLSTVLSQYLQRLSCVNFQYTPNGDHIRTFAGYAITKRIILKTPRRDR